MLRLHGIQTNELWMDTAAAHRVIYPELPRSLAYLASIYTLEPYWKDERKDSQDKDFGVPKDSDKFWRYCAMDSAVTHELAGKLLRQIDKAQLWGQVWPLA